ncbi:hypothetical protein Vafri_12731, partial [Volvox africanus]
DAIRESLRNHWVNPLYDSVLHTMDFAALAAVYEQLLAGQLTVPFGSAESETAAATPVAGASPPAMAPNCRDGKSSWRPADWLDILEPPLLLLGELLERFQQPHDRQVLAEVAPRLTATLAALYDHHVVSGGSGNSGGGGGGGGGGGIRAHQCARARRVRMTLLAIQKQLTHGQARVRILDEQEAVQRRTADAAQEAMAGGDRAAAERLRDPNYLPGSLRPSGCRHDNDHEDFRHIQVVPTCGELLCSEWPYLPSNRPGSMPHLTHDPQRARLEVNFRLLRHDVVAPLASALQKFRKLGGLAWLQRSAARQQQQAAASGRLELEGGSQLFVFRRVRVVGMAVTRQAGAYVKVTFDQPAMGGSNRSRSSEEWWRNSKRLSHGTLLCFWWEPPASTGSFKDTAAAVDGGTSPPTSAATTSSVPEPAAGPTPRLVVGVVARREAKELAGSSKDSTDKRPMVGIRLVQPADYEALLGAWLDWEGDPGPGSAADQHYYQQQESGGQRWRRQQQQPGRRGSEVVLVQEHNSFFAYEPVLRALQGVGNIPLAQYIVPGADAADPDDADAVDGDGDGDGTATSGALIGTTGNQQSSPSAPAGRAELPAYWLDGGTLDLRYIADRERVLALPADEQIRVLRVLAAVNLARPWDQFPLEELLAASTLDRSQAEALRAALAQEVAVVQGPPGTGKTFLGVTLARVLLRNTRSTIGGGDDDEELEDVMYGLSRDVRSMVSSAGAVRAALPTWIYRDVGFGAAAAPTRMTGNNGEDQRQALLPVIGPLLVVCFTNHALDSFLEGLLDSKVTSSIVRVGGSSRSAKLEPYNLRNLQGNAGGFGVKGLLERAKKLEDQAAKLSKSLQNAANLQRRPLTWDELALLVNRHHPKLYASFRRGQRPWNRRPDSGDGGVDGVKTTGLDGSSGLIRDEADADADGGGKWEVATGRKRNNPKRRRYSDLVSDDWIEGDPVLDWRRRRVILELERQATATAAAKPAEAAEADSSMIRDSDEDLTSGDVGEVDAAGDHNVRMEYELNDATADDPDGYAQQQQPIIMALPPLPGLTAITPWLTAASSQAAAAAATLTPAQMAYAAAIERLEQIAAAHRQQRRQHPQEAAEDDSDAEGGAPEASSSSSSSLLLFSSSPASSSPPTAPAPPLPPLPPPPGQELPGREAAEITSASAAADAPNPSISSEQEAVPAEIVALRSRCRPLEELLKSDDVWSMSRQERQLLHSALQRLRVGALLEKARELQDEYNDVQTQLQAEFDQAALKVLRSARVVGMTTSGVARHQSLVAAIKPRILMVEEAAEVFEAHVLVCLSRNVEHLILIGDHEQLRPKPNEYDLQAASGRGLDLDVSLFERLVRQGAAAGERGGASTSAAQVRGAGGRASTRGSGSSSSVQIATLLQQRRMRPQISQLIRLTIYPQLRDHPRVLTYPAVRGLASPLFFLDHDHPEGGGGGVSGEDRSKKNDWEAQFVVSLAKHLLLQGYKPEDLVILVPYVGQLFRVHRALEAVNVRVVVSDMDREQLERAGLEGDPDGGSANGNNGGSGGAIAVLPAVHTGGGGTAGGSWARGSAIDTVRGGILGRDSGTAAGGDGERADDSRVVTMREGVRVATVDNFQVGGEMDD